MGKTRSLAGMTLEQLTKYDRAIVRVLIKLFMDGKEGTAQHLSAITGQKLDTVQHGLRDLKSAGHIRICGWSPPDGGRTNWSPIYEAGSRPDAAKPKAKDHRGYKARKEQRDRKTEAEKVLEGKRAVTKEVADVLKPRLTPDQAHETNRRYWNWISGGAYG